jgi:type 2 lantibiotic biosynthesis protein LanM
MEGKINNLEWLKALTLDERKAHLSNLTVSQESPLGDDFDTNVADFRYKKLKSQHPFTDNFLYEQRLELDDLDDKQLYFLYGETLNSLAKRINNAPDFVQDLEDSLAASSDDEVRNWILAQHNTSGLQKFLLFSLPFISHGIRRLTDRLQNLSENENKFQLGADDINNLLLPLLLDQISHITFRVLTLELNVARMLEELQGDTSEERFANFIANISAPAKALEIFKEYPVMARQLVESVNKWVNTSFELLKRFHSDWELICKTFDIEPSESLQKILKASPDLHNKGQSVLILQFDSGKKIVYKPRTLRLDEHFAELINYLNDLGAEPRFKALKIIDKNDYGWNEFIDNKPCHSLEEVKNFYKRQGGYLALLYALIGIDFHFENIIACGEHPMLVDVEMLFQPVVKIDDERSQEIQLGGKEIENSVLKVGILPLRVWANDASEGVEVSGLAGGDEQVTRFNLPTWSQIGEEEMKIVYEKISIGDNKNRPKLLNHNIEVKDYLNDLLEGFETVYKLLLNNKTALSLPDGFLKKFLKDPVRILFRQSQTYNLIVRDSFHPDVMRDAIDRDILYDRLWAGVEHNSGLKKVIGAEKRDLLEGDIPIFYLPFDSKAVETSDGELINDLINESSLEAVAGRLERLGEDDLERQKWFIKSSFSSLHTAKETEKWVSYNFSPGKSDFNAGKFILEAEKIGDKIEKLALQNSDRAEWMELTLVSNKFWHVLPMGFDLYSGLSGVALFLAYLDFAGGKKKYASLLEKTIENINVKTNFLLQSAEELLEKNDAVPPSKIIGAFDGLSGVIYLYTHLGILWKRDDLLKEAEYLSGIFKKHIKNDSYLDIISGASGCLLSLISLYNTTKSENVLDSAVACGNHLIEKSIKTADGITWNMQHDISTGFSHGILGIQASLNALAKVSNQKIFSDFASDAISVKGNQISDDEEYNKNISHFTWCHGVSGIGIGEIISSSDKSADEKLNNYVNTIIEHGFGYSHSMCHGDIGNLDFLIEANRRLKNSEKQAAIENIADGILSGIRQSGYLCGVPQGIETPGFMVGLSGIGYGLLRAAMPENVPSVLSLAPPVI